MTEKLILEEASYQQVEEIMKDLLPRSWSNMNMIKHLASRFYFNTEETTKSTLKNHINNYWQGIIGKATNSKKLKDRASLLHSKVSDIVDSRPAEILIKKNMSDQEAALLKAGIKLQANKEVNQEQEVESYTQAASQSHAVRQAQPQILSQPHLQVPFQPQPQVSSEPQQQTVEPQPQVSSQPHLQVPFQPQSQVSSLPVHTAPEPSTSSSNPKKRRKKIDVKNVRKLSLQERISTIIEYYSNDKYTLDLRKARLIPVRCKSIVDSILQDSGLQLVPKLMVSEYNVLTKLSACSNKTSLYDAVQEISFFTAHNELSFIKMAVTKLCLLYHEELIGHSNNEDWYRVNVYGDSFDILFNMKHGYKTKRSECYSQTIKVLKTNGLVEIDEKDMRLDFIFTNSSGCQDLFFCEDKPSAKLAKKDKVKADYLRENTLRYWSSIVPYAECMKHLCALSCHFNCLGLKIMATKYINGVMIHECIKEVAMPSEESNGAGLAEYLAAVISLTRMVTWNFEAIQLMLKIVQQDDLTFLATPTTAETRYREDSDEDEDNKSNGSQASSADFEWEEDEKKLRVLGIIDSGLNELLSKANEQYVSFSWEDIVFNN